MKITLIIGICFISNILLAQKPIDKIHNSKKTIYLINTVGDSIRIIGSVWELNTDSVMITVEKIKNKKSIVLQNFKAPYTFPLKLKKASFNCNNGILIQYDPAAKNGNCLLYLLNRDSNKLVEVKSFRNLGSIRSLTNAGQKYYYSYSSCGCADNCWKSIMFKIQKFQIDTIAFLHCDCERLMERSKDLGLRTSIGCEKFNNNHKFENINEYWIGKISNIK